MRTNTDGLLQEAVSIAEKVLSGELQPNAGCALIGKINQELNWPPELSSFGILAHDQTGHEGLGMTAESCVPEILDECKKLVAYAANHSLQARRP